MINKCLEKWNLFPSSNCYLSCKKSIYILAKAVEERLQSIYLSDLLDDVDSVLEREWKLTKTARVSSNAYLFCLKQT